MMDQMIIWGVVGIVLGFVFGCFLSSFVDGGLTDEMRRANRSQEAYMDEISKLRAELAEANRLRSAFIAHAAETMPEGADTPGRVP